MATEGLNTLPEVPPTFGGGRVEILALEPKVLATILPKAQIVPTEM